MLSKIKNRRTVTMQHKYIFMNKYTNIIICGVLRVLIDIPI